MAEPGKTDANKAADIKFIYVDHAEQIVFSELAAEFIAEARADNQRARGRSKKTGVYIADRKENTPGLADSIAAVLDAWCVLPLVLLAQQKGEGLCIELTDALGPMSCWAVSAWHSTHGFRAIRRILPHWAPAARSASAQR